MDTADRPRRSPSDAGGFTLVEIIIALVILCVGILAVTTMSSSSIYQVRKARDLTNAALAAQQVLERLKTTPYDSVDVGTHGDTLTIGNVHYSMAWTITDATDSEGSGGNEVKEITVYAGGGLTLTNAVSFETAIYKPAGGS